ncbi:hypothetical protein TcasGA2_TC013144 [Tribolium castaneum]|uniref:UPAR/Ly6 domain-containing protein n=1 Tax=Tribolium castaneum TaxID=7070 RepID=D6WNI4_TRICA|nr:hypothetical protein TcasGA2_TC013144 [Tribolium castaneum]
MARVYSLKCYYCGSENCESPSEDNCDEEETYCVAVKIDPEKKDTDYVTAMGCATENIAKSTCRDVKQRGEGNCYDCQEDLCNEKLPELK